MSTTLATLINNVTGLTLAGSGTVYTPGSFPATFTLTAGGSNFGSPSAANPVRMTVVTSGTYQTASEVSTIYFVTGVSGNVITVSGVADGSTDHTFSGGDRVDLRYTAGEGNDFRIALTPFIQPGLSAAGTSQATATALTAPSYYGTHTYYVVTTASSGQGVALPTIAAAGMKVTIINASSTPLLVYPCNASGATINTGATNAPISIPTGQAETLISQSTSGWYSECGPHPTYTVYHTAGTYTHTVQPGVTTKILGQGAGGGGGGGGCGPNYYGGVGGSGGCYSEAEYQNSDLPATVQVVVGAPGIAGTSTTSASGANGGNGGAGNPSYVYRSSDNYNLLYAGAGAGGNGGGTTTPQASVSYTRSDEQGGNGGTSQLSAAGLQGGISVGKAAAGGGAGGGWNNTSSTAQAGGAGGYVANAGVGSTGGPTANGGGAGTSGSNGNAGGSPLGLTTSTAIGGGGGSGGGAGSSSSGTGGNGGAGGFPGGGGGGGGAIPANGTSGAGGAGASGCVVVITK